MEDKGQQQGAASASISKTEPRLKREDCSRTKHDSPFSQWKLLIGPSDWEDYLLGKEGAEKYRMQNLPNCSSCPGVYELGIALLHPQSGRGIGKLDPNSIIPVYIGQAENVRTRLQRYGREGAHLDNCFASAELKDSQKEPGLFKDIFSRGYSIVYRWAPMNSKKDAEKTEAMLLNKFDYAWNKGSNGTRRPSEILEKLDRNPMITQFSRIAKKLQIFREKQGVQIEICKPLLSENASSIYTNQNHNNFLSRILKFGRSQPRLVSRVDFNEDRGSICGVALGHGSVCVRPPVEGRKRCTEHKGMKINAFIPKLITPPTSEVSMGSDNINFRDDADEDDFINKNISSVCGVALEDGSICTRQPAPRRKRCEDHKGRRTCGSYSESRTVEKEIDLHCPIFCERASYETGKPGRHQSQDSSGGYVVKKDYDPVCGVHLENGTFCTRRPVSGRKRCESHKGMRLKKAHF